MGIVVKFEIIFPSESGTLLKYLSLLSNSIGQRINVLNNGVPNRYHCYDLLSSSSSSKFISNNTQEYSITKHNLTT